MAASHLLVAVFPDRERTLAAAQALDQAGFGLPRRAPLQGCTDPVEDPPPPRVGEDEPRGTLVGFDGEGGRLCLEVSDQRLPEARRLVEAYWGVVEVEPLARPGLQRGKRG